MLLDEFTLGHGPLLSFRTVSTRQAFKRLLLYFPETPLITSSDVAASGDQGVDRNFATAGDFAGIHHDCLQGSWFLTSGMACSVGKQDTYGRVTGHQTL